MNDYQWKLLLYSTIIILSTIGCISILVVAGNINNSYRQYDSFNINGDFCYSYGDNVEYARLCMQYAQNNFMNNVSNNLVTVK